MLPMKSAKTQRITWIVSVSIALVVFVAGAVGFAFKLNLFAHSNQFIFLAVVFYVVMVGGMLAVTLTGINNPVDQNALYAYEVRKARTLNLVAALAEVEEYWGA